MNITATKRSNQAACFQNDCNSKRSALHDLNPANPLTENSNNPAFVSAKGQD